MGLVSGRCFVQNWIALAKSQGFKQSRRLNENNQVSM